MTWGVDGVKGTITDMKDLGVWEPLSVKLQTYKTAIEVCCLLILGAHAPKGYGSVCVLPSNM